MERQAIRFITVIAGRLVGGPRPSRLARPAPAGRGAGTGERVSRRTRRAGARISFGRVTAASAAARVARLPSVAAAPGVERE